MADLTYSLTATYAKNGTTIPYSTGNLTATLAGDGAVSAAFVVTENAAVALPLAGVASPGLAFIENLDADNFIEIGYDDDGFEAVMKIQPGQAVLVSLDGVMAAPYAQADTDDVLIRYSIFDQ
jgi:hypothetical protein